MKKIVLFLFTISFHGIVFAQSNLINNWSFDASPKGKPIKIKEAEMIQEAMGWSSPITPQADLYSRHSKEPNFFVPTNQYGRQDVDDGCCYAGIVTFGEKEKMPKTYISTQLTTPLQKDSFYCVNFKVSLSDLSKYASNNIGAAFSVGPIDGKMLKSYSVVPQFLPMGNKIQEDQYLWNEICGMIKAQGDESHVTFGNFSSDANTQTIKVKKPKEFSQQQIPNAYYFIDELIVYKTDSTIGCKCRDTETKEEIKVIYKKSESDDVSSNPAKMVEYKFIYFVSKTPNLSDKSKALLDEVAKILTENAQVKVNVFASSDKQEEIIMAKSKIDISKKRAEAVINYLIEKGISKDRLIAKPIKDTQAKESKDENILKNDRKVWFTLIP